MTKSHQHLIHGKAFHSALWIAVCFMILEIIGGWFAHSLALYSDALHMLTDVGALLLGLIVTKIASRPPTPSMSFGYHRAEIIGALISAASLWALSGALIYEAVHRLFHPTPVQGPLVFTIATIGFLANVWMVRILHPMQDDNLNIRAAYLHVLSDLLGSIGVILSGLILWITKWNPIDPLITILFTLFILRSSGKIILQSLSILMESVPPSIDATAVQKALENLPGVKEVHDLHIWAVSFNKISLSVHLVGDGKMDLLGEAHRLLEAQFGIRHMTIQVEDPKHFEPKYCYDCNNKL